MSDPYERDNISVTIKHDGKEGTWLVFHGSPAKVREQIITTFEMGEAERESPLFDLINEATRLFKAAGNVNSALGGRTIPPQRGTEAQGGSAWDRAQGGAGTAPEPEVDPNVARLTAEIEGATTVASLHELYARNKAAFDADADLFGVWKVKGKALS